MSSIGHNGGPTMDPGFGFRKHAWGKARAALMPTLPLEVVRIRVERAKRLGLDYKTYASIRATSGRDIVAFLFSGNALRLAPRQIALPAPVRARLADLPAGRIGAIYAPALPADVLAANPGSLDHAAIAPGFVATWAEARDRLAAMLGDTPRDGIVLVAATTVEQEWYAMGKLGGMLPADRFLAPAT